MRRVNQGTIETILTSLFETWGRWSSTDILDTLTKVRVAIIQTESLWKKRRFRLINVRLMKTASLVRAGDAKAARAFLDDILFSLCRPRAQKGMGFREKQGHVVSLYHHHLNDRISQLVAEAREAATWAAALGDPFAFWMEKVANCFEFGDKDEGLCLIRRLQEEVGLRAKAKGRHIGP